MNGAVGREPISVPQPLDLRLLPTAAVGWAGVAGTILLGWRFGVVLAGAFGLAGIGLSWLLFRNRPRGARTAVAALVAALLAGAGFAGAAAWQEHEVAGHPLARLAAGTTVTAEVVPTGDPKPLRTKAFGGRQWLVQVGLREYRRGSEVMRVGGAVLVVGSGESWSTVLPGQPLRFRARVDRAWRRDLTVAVLRAQGTPVAVGAAPWWQRAAGSVRERLTEAAARALAPDAAGLLPGMVDGDVSRLPDEVYENFRATDLAHLIAVSGTNVSIVLAAVLVSARACTVDLRAAVALAAVALVAFVVLARPSPSVLRAAAMGGIAIVALVTGRRRQAFPALCAAVIGLLAYSPRLSLDVGFALSVSATAGLVLVAPDWAHRLRERGWPRVVAEAFAVATAAFLLTAPVIVGLTGHLAPTAILANVLAEPVVAPITVLGAVAAVVACVWMPAAVFLLELTGPLLRWLLTVAEEGAALSVSVPLPTGMTGGVITAVAVTLVVGVLHRSKPGRRPG
ncbi:ComEC/Rec2 family competence protein [Nocardia sp. NPDC003482]